MTSSGVKNKVIKIIFFGNGLLAENVLAYLKNNYVDIEVIFHAHTREDLEEVVRLKRKYPEAHGVLASFGALIPSSVLEVFEPEGILNIHPSLLPLYRGASPIESAILNGDTTFGVSVMKLAPQMDAGPVYPQATLENPPLDKDFIYKTLAEMGVAMVMTLLKSKKPVEPVAQDDRKATFCSKFEKKDGILDPGANAAEVIYRKIVAFQGFPKAKYAFCGKNCAILEAHICEQGETALLSLPCADGRVVAVDRLQPDGGKAMDAKSFLNGYAKVA